MLIIVSLIGIAGALLLSAFYSAMETAAYSSSLPRIEYLAAEKKRTDAARILPLLRKPSYFMTLILIGNNLANFFATVITERFFSGLEFRNTEIWTTLVLTPICFVVAETLPKNLGRIHAGDYCMAGSRILLLNQIILAPLIWTVGAVGMAFSKIFRTGDPSSDASAREEVFSLLEAGVADGTLHARHHGIAGRILQTETIPVSDICVPLSCAASVKSTASREQILEVIRSSGHHHILVYERYPQQIAGMVALRDLMLTEKGGATTAGELMHQPVVISSRLSAARALRKLQQKGEHVGVVVDVDADNQALGVISVVDIVSHILHAKKAEES